ncbi:MAG TPA: MarR family transcriptional regulator [Candidatus Saccharimonadales bacterium]|jgi:DNA-binding MarR family transcriptional regulator|nr:MarR family transcriptional regulator [Candidatus Saccharimonadales bacterium]
MRESKRKNRGPAAREIERNNEIASRLHSAAIHLLRRLRNRDQASGIGSAQLSALSVLVFAGPRSLGGLAEAEQVKPPTMSRIAAGLEREGLLRRKKTEDKRRMLLEATAKGHKVLQEGRRRRVESLAEAISMMTIEEIERLRILAEVMERVIARL